MVGFQRELGSFCETPRSRNALSVTQVLYQVWKETRNMVSIHIPASFSLFGMVIGVAFAPIVILGTLFLIVKTVLGS